jgi:hypothetical protein
MILNICDVCVYCICRRHSNRATFEVFYSEYNLLIQEFVSSGYDLIYLFLLLIFNKIMNFLVQKKSGIC